MYDIEEEAINKTEYNGINEINFKEINFDLKELLNKLYPICFFKKDSNEQYRNKKIMKNILKKHYKTYSELDQNDD